MSRPTVFLILVLTGPSAMAQGRPDLVVADFEGETYSPWLAQGDAFGVGPAKGALPGQMAVEGFEGKGLVNSFRGGDDSTGTLTSPPIRLERPYLNFKIGGGRYPGETCLDLLLDGRVVRSSTGPNDQPGGSERLDWESWEVRDFLGKSVLLRVVDRRKGGWGHVSVDQIFQSDHPKGLVPTVREMDARDRYLLLPVDVKGIPRRVRVEVSNKLAREFDIRLAEGKPDFFAFLDLGSSRGERLKISAGLPAGSKSLGAIDQAAEPADPATLYREPGRPRFHFTSRRGWLNDPNGLVFLDGEYHLYYQHNPYGWDWGNMHWGHATSPDLIRWVERPIALSPRGYGDWAFSGSAVVDRDNSSGFGDGSSPPLVAAYTSTGRGECIISSLDRGRTWTEYGGNPVVKHEGRDPRLLWHAPTSRWVMAVYDEEGGRRDVVFHSSPDLKTWTFESRIAGFYECPDLFELPIQGKIGQTSWVLSAADGAYLLGRFDGKTFVPDPVDKRRTWHGRFYAAQTFSDEPKGRRVQIGWAQGIDFPDRPFNQQMTVPCELTLRPTPDGVRLFANPVAELESLRGRRLESPGQAFEANAEVEVGPSGRYSMTIHGQSLVFDADRKTLSCGDISAPMTPEGGRIRLRVLGDLGSLEVFGNDGVVAISQRRSIGPPGSPAFESSSSGEGTRVRSLVIHELRSSWR